MNKLTMGEKLVEIANSYEFKAFLCLRDAIKEALLKPEVKNSYSVVALGENFVTLINDRKISKKSIDAIFDPVTKVAISKNRTVVATRNGRRNKKPTSDVKLLALWKKWGENPTEYKNKTAFCQEVENKNIFTKKTAAKKVDALRKSNPYDSLEKILPNKNK